MNVWIALAAERHTLHHHARHWFGGLQDDRLAFCRVTQLGFLRLLTNKHVMLEEVITEPNEFPETWEAFTEGPLSSSNLWTETYLCAFAHVARLTLVTFDAKIPTREGVSCLLLGASS